MEGPGTLIRADAISEFHIENNLQYIDPATDVSSRTNFIDIRRGLHGIISNNTIAALPGARLINFINIGRGSDAVMISHNIFDIQSNSVKAAGGIYNGPMNFNIRATGNIYEGPFTTSFAAPSPWPAAIPKETNLSNVRDGNLFESESSLANAPIVPPRGPHEIPKSSTSACRPGDVADDAMFHYVCVATNRWKRVALSPF